MEPERSSPTVADPVLHSNLNSILREVVQHLLEKAAHANFFRNPVSCVVVDDYRDYVLADQDICLSQILQRTEAQYYFDVATFRADLQLMYKNATAYNGREGGKHAYEPVIHWAADILASAEKALHQWIPVEPANTGEQKLPRETAVLPDVPIVDAVCDPNVAPAAPASATAAAAAVTVAAAATQRPPESSPIPLSFFPTEQIDVSKPSLLLQQQAAPKSDHAHQPEQQPQLDQRQHDQKQEQAQEEQHIAHQRISTAGNGQNSPRIANGSSAGQQSSSPSSGSGAGSHSGLEALLAACELAAEQDSAPPHVGVPTPGGGAAAVDTAPERRSFPGCGGQSNLSQQQQQPLQPPPPQQQQLVLEDGETAHEPSSGLCPASTGKGQQQEREDPAASSEGAGMALCCVRSGGSSGGPEGAVTAAQAGASGGGGGGIGGVSGSYLTSNAFKNRRHKSKVYIKPNKVVYLPTTFVEEEFDVTALPLDCELRVEADGVLTDETFRVTIKAVPRQGLSTMYCMTNVMRFQQQYLNWQIYNWTRIDNSHIKIHLQSPSPSQTQLQRIDLDRSASMPEQVGRTFASRASEDGAFGYQSRGGSAAAAASLKRKSDTGRYNVTRVERRLVPEPGGRELLPLELRLSSTGYAQYPSPIPESPPASPQRRVSTACTTSAAAAVGMGPAALPPRAPTTHGPMPARLPSAQHFSLQSQQPQHQQQQQHIHQQQIQIHHHHHYTGGHYQSQSAQQLYHSGHQQHPHSHSQPHPHPHTPQHGGNGANSLALPYSLSQMQAQAQRGSNSSLITKHEHQTCSEDSSGPVAGADAAAAAPLQLAWHQAAAASGAGGYRPSRLPTGGAASRTASVLHQLEVQELAEQLQLQAQAAGTELSALAAVQLAVVTLQQQQQQQQSSLLTATLPRGSTDGAGGISIAPLELANAVDQERLLQQLGLGAAITLGHTQTRGTRCATGGSVFLHAASGRRESAEGGLDADYGGQRGPGNSGLLEVYVQQHQQHQHQHPSSSQLYHEEQRRRRSSQGERSRHGVSGSPTCKPQQHTMENDEVVAAADTSVTMADGAAYAAAVQSEKQLGGMTVEDVEGHQHIISYPRHSGTGGGLHVVGGGAGAANKLYPSSVGSLVAGGRIRFEVGPTASGGTLVMGPRVSGSGRRLPPASVEHLAKAAGVGLVAAAFPAGLELSDCTAADLISLLSPSKRFKVAVTTDNTGPAASATVGGGGGGDLPVLDMLNGLRAAAAAAGSRSLPTEAALTALRMGGGGSQAAAALASRSFLHVGPEILGQLM